MKMENSEILQKKHLRVIVVKLHALLLVINLALLLISSVLYASQKLHVKSELDIGYRFKLAIRKFKEGDTKQALEIFNDILKDNPDIAEVYNNIGYIYQKRGEFQAALTNYEKAVKLNSEYIDALNNLAYLLAYTGQDLDRAQYLINKVLKHNSSSRFYNDTAGYIAYKKGNLNDAIYYFNKALFNYPDYLAARQHLGMVYMKQDEFIKAIKEFKRVLILDEDNVETRYALYICLKKQGLFKQAQKEWEKIKLHAQHFGSDFEKRVTCYVIQSILQGLIEVYKVDRGRRLVLLSEIKKFPIIKRDFDIFFNNNYIVDEEGNIECKFHGKSIYLMNKSKKFKEYIIPYKFPLRTFLKSSFIRCAIYSVLKNENLSKSYLNFYTSQSLKGIKIEKVLKDIKEVFK